MFPIVQLVTPDTKQQLLKKNHKTNKQNIFYILTSLFLNRDHQLTFVDEAGNSDPFSYQIPECGHVQYYKAIH